MTACASSAPAHAAAPDTSGTPPSQASLASGLSAWEVASRPHGKPPNGQIERPYSNATQRTAKTIDRNHGERQTAGRRRAQTQAIPSAPQNRAWTSDSATHGIQPTADSAQIRCGRKKPRPNRVPVTKPQRAESGSRARTKSATPGKAAAHQLRSGHAALVSSPPPTASTAVGGGLLTNAACPDLSWWAAAFPGVALLVLALEPDSARWGFVTGTLFGLGFFLPHLLWADSAVGWIPWVALSLVQALFCGALGIAWVWARRLPAVWRSPWFRSIVFAVLWVAFEYGRSIWPFGGFPWGRLATSQADSPLARLAWRAGCR